MPTAAQRRALERYDQTRPAPITVRLNREEVAALDAARRDGESRGQALRRIAQERLLGREADAPKG